MTILYSIHLVNHFDNINSKVKSWLVVLSREMLAKSEQHLIDMETQDDE